VRVFFWTQRFLSHLRSFCIISVYSFSYWVLVVNRPDLWWLVALLVIASILIVEFISNIRILKTYIFLTLSIFYILLLSIISLSFFLWCWFLLTWNLNSLKVISTSPYLDIISRWLLLTHNLALAFTGIISYRAGTTNALLNFDI